MISLFLLKSQKYYREYYVHWKLFKDYPISYFKGNAKICYDDLINSFTYKIETFFQIELILERIKKAKHPLAEDLSQTASYIKPILDS